MQANDDSAAVRLEEVMNQLYDAASSEQWRPGPHPMDRPIPLSLTSSSHTAHVQRALDRAAGKSFVPAIKPLRRLLRNQGAVNDSVIEAVYHLFAQNQELIKEITELQQRLAVVERRVESRRKPPVDPTAPPPTR
ncbi:MAG: hypothetical protein ACJ8M1_04345 [Chthoniobacterales bacterium]